MTSYTIRFNLDQALKQRLTERKIGEDGNTKSSISREGNELFRWDKETSFIVFEGLLFGEK